MRNKFLSLAVLLVVATSVIAQPKWETLFNGKNLRGWKKVAGEAPYVVKDGAIVGTSVLNSANTFLATAKNYGDLFSNWSIKSIRV